MFLMPLQFQLGGDIDRHQSQNALHILEQKRLYLWLMLGFVGQACPCLNNIEIRILVDIILIRVSLLLNAQD